MKRILLITILLPSLAFSQATKKNKTAIKITKSAPEMAKPAGGFIIRGEINGFPDNTTVALLNGQTGVADTQTVIKSGKFILTGKLASPDFKILLFNNQPPYVTLFIDNSDIKVTGTKEKIEKAIVTGSKTHDDYTLLNNSLEPYNKLFSESITEADSALVSAAMSVAEKFTLSHPNSAITPLAIIRFNQLADDIGKTESLYNTLRADIKSSSIGKYIEQQINEEKKNLGATLPEFSQADTSGKMIALSSFRGKYVLIDFWASWCGPCRKENPNVVKAFEKYKNRNFTILGVSLDKTREPWIEAIYMDNLRWTQVSDLQGWSNAVALQNQILSIPQNYLIDPEGKVVGKNLRGYALEKRLARILK